MEMKTTGREERRPFLYAGGGEVVGECGGVGGDEFHGAPVDEGEVVGGGEIGEAVDVVAGGVVGAGVFEGEDVDFAGVGEAVEFDGGEEAECEAAGDEGFLVAEADAVEPGGVVDEGGAEIVEGEDLVGERGGDFFAGVAGFEAGADAVFVDFGDAFHAVTNGVLEVEGDEFDLAPVVFVEVEDVAADARGAGGGGGEFVADGGEGEEDGFGVDHLGLDFADEELEFAGAGEFGFGHGVGAEDLPVLAVAVHGGGEFEGVGEAVEGELALGEGFAGGFVDVFDMNGEWAFEPREHAGIVHRLHRFSQIFCAAMTSPGLFRDGAGEVVAGDGGEAEGVSRGIGRGCFLWSASRWREWQRFFFARWMAWAMAALPRPWLRWAGRMKSSSRRRQRPPRSRE